MTPVTTIIGVDCATDPRRVGLACAEVSGARPKLKVAEVGSKELSLADRIASWFGADSRTLLAMDAPLGWPVEMGPALTQQRAGEYIDVPPDRLFQRETDRVVHRVVGRRPLEVGAERIARTALAALALLEQLRQRLDQPISLAWSPQFPGLVSAIEVYPAGTLRAYGLPASGYKKRGQSSARQRLIEWLSEHIEIQGPTTLLEENADALDAVICVLAGWDFLRGLTIAPTDPEQAAKEGWIWVLSSR
jgi:predicted RNase H-like nuclease